MIEFYFKHEDMVCKWGKFVYQEGDAAGDFYIIMEGEFLVEKMVDINPKVKKKAKTMQKFKSLRRVKSDKNKR